MDLFEAGEIVKTRGLHGCMKAISFLEAAGFFTKLKFVYINDVSGQKILFPFKKTEISGNFLFFELENVSDVQSAEKFIGRKLYLPKAILEILPTGEYYYHDIIGLDVYTQEGNLIGIIESIFPTGSNDVYVCRGKTGEILLPATKEVIKQIDLNKRVMKIKLLNGM